MSRFNARRWFVIFIVLFPGLRVRGAAREPIDVYIIAGQSNAGALGCTAELAAPPIQSHAQLFAGNEDGRLSAHGATADRFVAVPEGDKWPGWCGYGAAQFGVELSFAAALPRKSVILRFSRGGTDLSRWLSRDNYAEELIEFCNSSLRILRGAPFELEPVIKGSRGFRENRTDSWALRPTMGAIWRG